LKPERSNATLVTPAALARSAIKAPTLVAASTLPVVPARKVASKVEAAGGKVEE
jgi:hypothetical protein